MKKKSRKYVAVILMLLLSELSVFAENAITPEKNTNTSSTPGITETAVSAQRSTVTAEAAKAQYELEDVVITGTKTKLKIKDSPAAVEVVTQKEIDQKNVVYSDDLVTGLSGVQVARTEKGDQSTVVTMRGIPGYDKNLVLLDGRSIQNPYNGRVFWNRVPVELVDRVEVVKGAFSSLYGQYAIGGVINIITKEPQGRSFNYKTSYDSTGILTNTGSFQDKPIDQFAYYLGFEDERLNGYSYYQYIQKSALTYTATAGTQATGYKTTTDSQGNVQYIVGETAKPELQNDSYSAKLYYFPSSLHTVSFLVNYSVWDQPTADNVLGKSYLKDASGNIITSGNVQLSGTDKIISLKQTDFYRAPGQNLMIIYILDYKGKVNDILSLSASGSYAIGTQLNSVGTLANNATALSGSDSAKGGLGDQYEKTVNLQSKLNLGSHRLIFGGAYDNCLNRNAVTTHSFWRELSYTVLYDSYKSEGNIYSAYGQDEWKIFDPLTAFLGVRYDDWSRKNGTVYDTSLSEYVHYPETKADVVSPKISLVYRPSDSISIRSSVGTAFNPPTSAELYSYSSSSTGQTISNPNLVPEKDVSWELGGEYTLPTKTTISGTYFENYLQDLIYTNVTFGLNNYTTTQYVNAGKAIVKGAEAEIKHPVFSFLDAVANYTYVYDTIVENNADLTSVGKFIPGIAQHSANFQLNFKWDNCTFDFTETYQSKIYRTSNNSDTVNGVQGSYDPFATSYLKIAYSFGTAKISVGVENIGGVKYYTIYQTPGRTYNIGLKYNWQ